MKTEKAKVKWRGELIPLNLKQTLHIALHHMAHPTADYHDVHRWHLDRGWKGIAYNYWIGFDGTIWECRGLNEGGGVSGKNSYIISIGFQGDYDKYNKVMPDTQYKAGVECIKYLVSKLNIGEIDGHKRWDSTSCPGRYFTLEKMKGEIEMSWEQRNKEFVKKFQSATGLVVDGKAGEKTFTMFEAVKPLLSDFVNQEDNYPSYEVKQLNGIKYVEIGPLSLGSELVYDNANNLAKKYPNFTGGMFSDGNPNWPTKGRLFCLLAIDGKKIFTTQTYDKKPKGTLVIYNDGNVQVNTVRDLASVAGTKLVIQGFNLDYEKNGSRTMNESILNEGWLSDVYRYTTRSAIGYNPSKKKIIIAHITGTANELRLAMRKLGSVDSDNNTIGIGMDGGSMDALVVNGKVIVNGGGWLRHIITF